MSTYYIADSIDKFTKAFKEVISEKNKIEKERLAFEKEKFEFEKKKEQFEKKKEQCDKRLQDKNLDGLISDHIKNQCNHNWKFESYVCLPQDMCYIKKYVCSKCGESKTEEDSIISCT